MKHGTLFRIFQTIDVHLFQIGDQSITLGTVLVIALVVVCSYGFSLLVQRGVARAIGRKGGQSVPVVSRLLHYAIIGSGLSIALETAGIHLSALFAAGAVFAVGIGFAMQNIAQNFVSGVILLVEQSIRPGDILEVEDKQVRVVEMGIRATRVRSRHDEVLIVPNSTLVQSTVRSFTLLDTLCRVPVSVGVAYTSDMRVVRATLEDVARSIESRYEANEPVIMLTDFSASTVDWEVSIWIEDPWRLRMTASLLREAIWNAFAEKGIQMAFPQMDVHLDDPVVAALREIGPRAA